MMLPLWTSVTDGRWWSMAYWIAWRTSRLLPNSLTGLMPMADPGRTFLPSLSLMKAITALASSVSASHSTPEYTSSVFSR